MGLQLPRWVWVGAVTLACIAGMVNVVGYLGFEHQAVSHLTGTTSLLGAALAAGDWRAVAHLWGVLIAFCVGAMLSGLIIQDGTLRLGRRYGVVLALESLLLAAAGAYLDSVITAWSERGGWRVVDATAADEAPCSAPWTPGTSLKVTAARMLRWPSRKSRLPWMKYTGTPASATARTPAATDWPASEGSSSPIQASNRSPRM